MQASICRGKRHEHGSRDRGQMKLVIAAGSSASADLMASLEASVAANSSMLLIKRAGTP